MSVAGSGRLGLALLACTLGLSGFVVATDGAVPVVPAPVVTLAPVAACSATGPYVVPERGSVGLPPSLRLCPSGPLTVTEPGTVLDGLDLRGGVVVDAPDVVVRRSRVTGDGSRPYGIVTTGAGSVRVEDTTLTGRFTEAAVGGDRWTAERIEIVGVSGDGAHAGRGSRLRASVASRFAPGSGADGVTLLGPDVVVEDSTVRMGTGHRSAVRIAPGRGDGPVVVRANVLGGGEYTVHQDGGSGADVSVVDNRFARDAGRAPLRVPATAETTGNTFVDGAPAR